MSSLFGWISSGDGLRLFEADVMAGALGTESGMAPGGENAFACFHYCLYGDVSHLVSTPCIQSARNRLGYDAVGELSVCAGFVENQPRSLR